MYLIKIEGKNPDLQQECKKKNIEASHEDENISNKTKENFIHKIDPIKKFFLIDVSKSQMVHASWWYYFSKFTEFMDTVCKVI